MFILVASKPSGVEAHVTDTAAEMVEAIFMGNPPPGWTMENIKHMKGAAVIEVGKIVDHRKKPEMPTSSHRWRNDLNHGFAIVASGNPDVNVPASVCNLISKMPDVVRYRKIYGDRGLSSKIVEVILQQMNEETISQAVVDKFVLANGL
jgi:hypothetical protein